ncbi:MlaC/ttg2D family ABC transporter substrate-binding protein [Meridianimarinicoccus sp. RP-17]|uniref:MlaC/ttg2D family ABC transporter substrate-binding protein n=1 Tax=Meridianimarinicoccus zhengii TaxID=2056810 RepID=UPI001F29890D|nr:ABC transporter substrate-binding protein [Phycocomes zhengii]
MTLTRRGFAAALAAASLLPGAAHALTNGEAESLVRSLVADIQSTIDSGKSTSAILADFERAFKRYADVPTIARFSLGVAARSASSAELRAYSDAYASYVSNKYGRRFQEFKGGSIDIRGVRSEGQYLVVQARANLRGQSPVAVDFHVSDRSGSPKVFNVIIEGVNMLTTERAEIGSLLDRAGGSIPRLTQDLRAAS